MNDRCSGDADRAIDRLYEAWKEAFRRRDVDAVLVLLTADYVLWAPEAPPLGREAVRRMLEVAFATHNIEPAFEREDRFVDGDLAVECGWDVQTATLISGGTPQSRRQRVFLVLRRGQDGEWRFARGMSQPGPPHV
jgi:uncharacterized protein (TIGR02246 family)